MFNGTSCTSRQSYSNMTIEAPPGNNIGGIKPEYKFTLQGFSIVNGDGETVMKIVRSAGQFFSSEVDFKVCMMLCILSMTGYAIA